MECRFLLKYISRDSVDLLGRGKGGVHEARVEISKYQETSPLYGLIVYRRRKVLIKYIPNGTSRLLQGITTSPYMKARALTKAQLALPFIFRLCPTGSLHTKRSWKLQPLMS